MADFLDLYNQFLEIIEKGDEERARDFLITHFDEFPDDIKTNIVGAFFEEAVDKLYYALTAEQEYFSQILETKEALEKLKKILEDKRRELELKREIIESEE